MDLKQRSRVKWAVDGDENINFFHAVVNYRCRRNKLKGLICDGSWTSDPSTIQSTIFTHFAERFQDPNPIRHSFLCSSYKKLSTAEASGLETLFSVEEIKEAVWSCNGSKSPGPDGLNFNFIKKFWPILGNSFSQFMWHFKNSGIIGRGCNASFISLIPKKVDPLEVTGYRPISLLGCSYKVIANSWRIAWSKS